MMQAAEFPTDNVAFSPTPPSENLSRHSQPLGVLQGQKHTLKHRHVQWRLMRSHNLIERIITASPCHLLRSLGGLLPLVCHLEPSVQSVL